MTVGFGSLQREALTWQQARQRAHKLCHDVVNLRNKSSYLSTNKVHAALGTAAAASASTASLALMQEDLADRIRALRATHEDMYNCLDRMATLQFDVFPEAKVLSSQTPSSSSAAAAVSSAAIPMTFEAYSKLRDQLHQQTFLECCIAEDLCGGPDDEGEENSNDEDGPITTTAAERGDQDALTTMLACLTYPPYLREPDLAAFLVLT